MFLVTDDAECETQIRRAATTALNAVLPSEHYAVHYDVHFLLRLLDEARADCTTACELAQTVTDELTDARAEIARGANTMRQQAETIMEQQREIARLNRAIEAAEREATERTEERILRERTELSDASDEKRAIAELVSFAAEGFFNVQDDAEARNTRHVHRLTASFADHARDATERERERLKNAMDMVMR
jgi:hypothetical protein